MTVFLDPHKDARDPLAYQRAKALYDAYPLTIPYNTRRHSMATLSIAFGDGNFDRRRARILRPVLDQIFEREGYFNPSEPYFIDDDLDFLYREQEERLQHLTDHLMPATEAIAPFIGYIARFFQDGTGTRVPLIELLDWRLIVSCIIQIMQEGPLFPKHSAILTANTLRVSGATVETFTPKTTLKTPYDFDGTPAQAVHAFLQDTPFEDLLMTPVPFIIEDIDRFSHAWCLGSSGTGKSTLLERQFLDDIERSDQPAIIVIDPKGTMIDRLSHLAVFHPEHGRHRDRLIILDPQRDPPALNLFDPFTKRFNLYSNEVKRQVENTTVGLFEYIFASNDMPLTPKQGTCFSMCARLLYSMPGSTMETFLDLLLDPATFDASPFRQHILRQPPIVQRFFRDAFYHKTEYGETKRQIANRIYDMLASQQFAAMFMAKRRKFDAFDCLQQGKIVLVSSPIASLGVDGSTMFSRTICSMILSAAFERIAHPKHTWRPAFLMIDEAQVVMDDVVTQRLLQMAREFRVGVTHAHQQIKGQLSEALFSTLSANTAIKYCATRSYDDAQKIARDMGQCDPAFILGQKVYDGHAHFACHVDGKTPHPVSIAVPIGGISKQPQMTRDEHERLLARNRLLVAVGDEPMPSFSPAPKTHNAPEAEVSEASHVLVPQPAEADPPSVPQKDDDGCTW